MSTTIRPTISKKNKYWISRHRYYELKHFCLQYPTWKKAYTALNDMLVQSPKLDNVPSGNLPSDMTAKYATIKTYYWEKIQLVENAALQADPELSTYILKAVTEDLSFNYLKSRLEIPCCKDTYYDRYRRFFWLLNKVRD